MTTAPTTAAALAAAWHDLKQTEPKLRTRDAAQKLGVTEAELVATGILDGSVVRLAPADWATFVQQFASLGHVMCLTRNEACVLEHHGPFEQIDITRTPHGDMATVIGPIELRVFFKLWTFAFAVSSIGQHGKPQRSIQVFDKGGEAILKVFLEAESHEAAYEALVEASRAAEQSAELTIEPVTQMPTLPIAQVDAPAFLEGWATLQDTHDYFGLLRKHKVGRLDAMRLAEGRFTRRIDAASLEHLLTTVAREPRLPIMIFAGNNGNIQIHQDEVRHIKTMGPWLNVLDPNFNMHLRTDLIDTAWEVHKPTADGQVTSIECFDAQGNLLVQFFGLRKPGIPEREDWRALAASLPAAA